ncbi:relaxase/mobilization nuclease domain-containing protein [[Clostridium] innocuum]|nr:relaxase/mobilization nuclease domain-containing protein [[Clostridium] innocuum]
MGIRFTKGKHSFIVDTHTDKAHIHNHVIFNSTNLKANKKFNNFWFSGLAIQRLSDMICLENGLSVIEKKPYRERQKRTEYPKRDSFRTGICVAIDDCLTKKPKDFEAFLLLMEQSGYEIKRGKYTAVRGKGQKRFIRFRSLGDGYTEEDIVAAILGKDKKPELIKPQKLNLLIDIQEKIISKGVAYERWATNFNLKSMSKTLLFLRDHKIETVEDLKAMEEEATNKFNDLSAGIKEKEAKMAEMLALKKQIFNYADTREIYIQYRKSGYSRKFFEQNRQAITLHKAAKQAFNECGLEKIPTVKELNVMYHEQMSEKKQMYSEYHQLKNEMQELMKARKNVERFLSDEAKNDEREKEAIQ